MMKFGNHFSDDAIDFLSMPFSATIVTIKKGAHRSELGRLIHITSGAVMIEQVIEEREGLDFDNPLRYSTTRLNKEDAILDYTFNLSNGNDVHCTIEVDSIIPFMRMIGSDENGSLNGSE